MYVAPESPSLVKTMQSKMTARQQDRDAKRRKSNTPTVSPPPPEVKPVGHIDRKPFRVHCHILWERSDTFRPPAPPMSQMINLLEQTSDCFETYRVFYAYRKPTRDWIAIPVRDLPWDTKWRFIWECYFMGEALAELTFCDALMDRIVKAATSMDQNGSGLASIEAFWSNITELVDTAYRMASPGSKARSFFVDTIVRYCIMEQT
ncbi:hypothetical protein AC578_8164 [Pseudocercospora eumusae]|uniref:Uncharacterized protein n=1 Tax=Pseudocercospora eumusae TaxID=321146 RepID=A0A139HAF7_9PEZI|nr:hypothetical protein AC578_8164 [Pseudocercospora eumusae]